MYRYILCRKRPKEYYCNIEKLGDDFSAICAMPGGFGFGFLKSKYPDHFERFEHFCNEGHKKSSSVVNGDFEYHFALEIALAVYAHENSLSKEDLRDRFDARFGGGMSV